MESGNTSDAEERAATERSGRLRSSVAKSGGWERVERTSAFGELVSRKRAFIVPAMLFFFVFFMAWSVLGGLTTVLDGRAVGTVTWAVVYGFAQFIVVLIVLHLYMRQARKWDRLAEESRQETPEERTTA